MRVLQTASVWALTWAALACSPCARADLVHAAGYNDKGELGDGTYWHRSTPVRVLDIADVVAVSAGLDHSLALRADGTLWAWGYNSNGQLGDGTTTLIRTTAVQVSGLTDCISASGGWSHSLAVRSDGSVWAWGTQRRGSAW